jgi:hypothetical protein
MLGKPIMAYTLFKLLEKLSFATLAVTLIGTIPACAQLQPIPQPGNLPQPSETAPPEGGESKSPSWSKILTKVSAPDGWQVYPCDNPTLLCVQENGQILGTVELITFPVKGSHFSTMLATAGVSTDSFNVKNPKVLEALKLWVEDHYNIVKRDRESNPDGKLIFSSTGPENISVGRLPGLSYKFQTIHANGTLFERTVGYVTTDGNNLYLIVVGLTPGDFSGTFSDNIKLGKFEPYLADIIPALNLPISK